MTQLNREVAPKRLELLHELLPTVSIIALLANPTDTSSAILSNNMISVAHTLGLELHVSNASTERDRVGFQNVFILLERIWDCGVYRRFDSTQPPSSICVLGSVRLRPLPLRQIGSAPLPHMQPILKRVRKSRFLFPLRAKPRLAPLGSSRLGLLINDGLGNLRQCLVRRFLFPQRRLQELDGIRQA